MVLAPTPMHILSGRFSTWQIGARGRNGPSAVPRPAGNWRHRITYLILKWRRDVGTVGNYGGRSNRRGRSLRGNRLTARDDWL
jgi:hypothetical protein